ncbi:hypothetical protein [Psychrobacter piscatorii]|uniref:hypothetical protein n=1 Tax=Psychrobacter piscatorii TaxID=554343 RepID=UPI00191854E9|nr:hypothetical protein [Psychrobacter piscatorii]
MSEFDSLESAATALGDGGLGPDLDFDTVEEFVETLIDTGNTDKVFAYHDDHLGLKDSLSKEVLEMTIDDADEILENADPEQSELENQLKRVLDEANTIIPLSKRELSEDDLGRVIN